MTVPHTCKIIRLKYQFLRKRGYSIRHAIWAAIAAFWSAKDKVFVLIGRAELSSVPTLFEPMLASTLNASWAPRNGVFSHSLCP
jgi:hypothetical protein